jgi:hypothetical protein
MYVKVPPLRKALHIVIYIYALIGFFLTTGYCAILLGFTKTHGIEDNQRTTFQTTGNKATTTLQKNTQIKTDWNKGEEWVTLQQAIINDKDAIMHAATLFNINPRLIVAIISVEQLRLYTDNREVFKRYFKPLTILGVQTQYSWGVAGIKKETAEQTEFNLTSSTSPFYPGDQYAHILDFATQDVDSERFSRITDEHDRLYSYLYTAAVIKELQTQWGGAGFTIENDTAVLATLYNIGFSHSKPHANPRSGGAAIDIGGNVYSFGRLAEKVYTSNELLESFPR